MKLSEIGLSRTFGLQRDERDAYCEGCGAVVLRRRREQHEQWHKNLADALAELRNGKADA